MFAFGEYRTLFRLNMVLFEGPLSANTGHSGPKKNPAEAGSPIHTSD